MSAYEGHPRVALSNNEAVVHGHPDNWKVIKMDGLGWCVFRGANMDLIGSGHASMDDAIRSLVGKPVVTS